MRLQNACLSSPSSSRWGFICQKILRLTAEGNIVFYCNYSLLSMNACDYLPISKLSLILFHMHCLVVPLCWVPPPSPARSRPAVAFNLPMLTVPGMSRSASGTIGQEQFGNTGSQPPITGCENVLCLELEIVLLSKRLNPG